MFSLTGKAYRTALRVKINTIKIHFLQRCKYYSPYALCMWLVWQSSATCNENVQLCFWNFHCYKTFYAYSILCCKWENYFEVLYQI